MAAEIIPLLGEVAAAHRRLLDLEEEMRTFANEHRQAIGNIVLAEADQKAVDDALDKGDIDLARRANARARQHLIRARINREKAKGLTEGLAGMIGGFRRWVARVGL